MSLEEMNQFIVDHGVVSPEGNSITQAKTFNLLFESSIGAVSDDKSKVYLRGETAQGIFTNFKQVLDSTRVQLPFGIGQMGKSFRNEITTGQFIFRTLELEQAEIEYFFDPEVSDWQTLFKKWQDAMWHFVTKTLGIDDQSLRWRQHTDKERSFYSKDTYDLDFEFPFGWKELWGVAYRTDYDLLQHAKHSGEKLEYRDPHTNRVFVPHVIEPALGIGRAFLMVLANAYWEDTENNRVVLKIKPRLAPYQVAVFPLLKNKPELVAKARDVYSLIKKDYRTTWDDRGNIGKRYLYQDEIGTPFCVTIDFDTLSDSSVTVHHQAGAHFSRQTFCLPLRSG
jgi:glycyl-tRNA synthetase